jgi:hypothetical protein
MVQGRWNTTLSKIQYFKERLNKVFGFADVAA